MRKKLIRLIVPLILLVIFIILFYVFISYNPNFKRIEFRYPPYTSIFSFSFNNNEDLIGVLEGNDEVYFSIKTTNGDTLFESNLNEFNPSSSVQGNKVYFTSDNNYAVFNIGDKENQYLSKIIVVDIKDKKINSFTSGGVSNLTLINDNQIVFDVKTVEPSGFTKKVQFMDFKTGQILRSIPNIETISILPNGNKLAFIKILDQTENKLNLQILDLKTEEITPTEILVGNNTNLYFSPNEDLILIEGVSEGRDNLNKYSIYDIENKIVNNINYDEYLTNPVWIDDKYLTFSFWQLNPFGGNNGYIYRGISFYNLKSKSFENMCMLNIHNDYLINQSTKNIFVFSLKSDQKLIKFSFDKFLNPTKLDKFRNYFGLGNNKYTSYKQGCYILEPEMINPKSEPINVKWNPYSNDTFGISFNYPSNWSFNVADEGHWMNIAMSNGSEGIESQVISLNDNQSLTEDSLMEKMQIFSNGEITKDNLKTITLDGHIFKRAEIINSPTQVTYYYFLNEPIYPKPFYAPYPKKYIESPVSVLYFKLNSYSYVSGYQTNESLKTLEKMLGSIELKYKEPQTLPR